MRVVLILMLAACSKPTDDKKAAPVVAAKPKDFKACDLTSAAEVGKIFGKAIATGADASICSFNDAPGYHGPCSIRIGLAEQRRKSGN